MHRSCGKLPICNPAVYKHKFFARVEIHLVSSNVLAVQNLFHGECFMSRALVRIKRLQSKPILIRDIMCFPGVGNDRKRCLLD